MMNYVIVLLGLLLLGQCHHETLPEAQAQEPGFGTAFLLQKDEEVKVSGEAAGTLTLQLASLADSRCPKDVVCVWLGNATVVLNVSNTDGQNQQVSFCIGDCRPDPVRNKHRVQVMLGQQAYDITLLEVLPVPNAESNETAKEVKLLVELV